MSSRPSREETLRARSSSQSRQSGAQQRAELAKKRASSVAEANLRNSQHQLQESINATNFPYPVSFEECRGIDEVLIAPPYMEFKDGSEGSVAQQVLTIRNLGTKAAIVRLYKPNSMIFQLKTDAMDARKLYPGLSLSALVNYSFQQSSSPHAMIPIEINGTCLDYHLICTFSTPHLVAEPAVLDFGCVDVDSVSDVKTLALLNSGAKSARFSVDAGSSHHLINIRPERGFVKPNETIRLGVQLVGKREGMLNGSLWIKSNPNICISVKANIIKPKLIVDCPGKVYESVLIDFPPTYLQTRRYQSLTLKNDSAQATSFVAVTKEDCKHFQGVSEIHAMANPNLDVFKIHPSEGRLRPFEEATLSISFSPTFRQLELLRKLQRDGSADHFVGVVKICKIQAAEAKSILKTEGTTYAKVQQNIPHICAADQSTKDKLEENSLEDDDAEGRAAATLYLHGAIEIPRLEFQPDQLHLNSLNVDDRVERTICIANPSENLALRFAFVARAWVRCRPSQALLKPKQRIPVAISVRAQFNRNSRTSTQLLHRKRVLVERRLLPFPVEAAFRLEFDAWAASWQGENDSRPRDLLVSRLSLRCSYNPLRAPAADTSSRHLCQVASLNKLPMEQELSLTYTRSQLHLKMSHRDYWARYFREIFSAPEHGSQCATDVSLISGSLSDAPRYSGSRLIAKPCAKPPNSEGARIRGVVGGGRAARTLTALQLFKVRVSPRRLDFGRVARRTESRRPLTFENMNGFEITICLTSLDESNVTFPHQSVVVVKPKSSLTCCVQFRAQEHFGKFSSYVNYAVNREHKYQLALLANVVFKSLRLRTKQIVFERGCHPSEGHRLPFEYLEIENELNADATFNWILPENSNFTIEPQSGCVSAGSKLYGSIYQGLEASRANRIEATIRDEDGACANLKVEAVLRAPKVSLVNDSTDIGQIPLNLAHRAETVLYNAEYFAVFFEIDEGTLVRGIGVSPARGCIKPRGIVVLTARLHLDVCIECSAQIDILVQKRLRLQWNLKFAVVFPKIKFEPSVVEWKRVCLNSYRLQEVSAINLTDAELVIKFLLNNFNEFHVSTEEFKSCIPITRGDSCFKIGPRSTIRLFLHFTPCDLAHYSFHLPLVINDLLGPVTEGDVGLNPSSFVRSGDEYYSSIKGLTFLAIPAKLPTIFVSSIVTHPLISFNKLCFHLSGSFPRDNWNCCNNSPDTVTVVVYTKLCSRAGDFPFVICWASGAKPTRDENRISVCLKPKERIHLRILFNPREPKAPSHFAFELPISLIHDGNEQTYNKLILDGVLSKASIESDVLQVNLAPLPLNTLCKQRFHLRLSNFAEATFLSLEIGCPEISSPMPGDALANPLLDISFPCGNAVKPYCSHNVQVEVQFASRVPLSFCTKVTFFDERKTAAVSIGICATADNSLLSTHDYENKICGNFLLIKRQIKACNADASVPLRAEDAGITQNVTRILDEDGKSEIAADFDKVEKRGRSDEKASNSSDMSMGSADRYVSMDATAARKKKRYSPSVVEAVEGWLYDEVLRYEFNPRLFDGRSLTLLKSELLEATPTNDKKKEYPKLRTYIDILLRLTDDQQLLQFEYPERSSKSSESLVVEALQLYKEILKFLLSKGAFVAHFPAEYLLNYKEYKILMQKEQYLLDRDTFQFCSEAAWIDLLLQSYKVFALAQITQLSLVDHAQSLDRAKSVDSSPNAKYAIDVANIMSHSKRRCRRVHPGEALLLAWLQFNNALYFKARSIDDFGTCLSDSLAFIAVTLNYCPFLHDFFTMLYRDATTAEQKIHNAVCLLLAWKKIRLGFTVTPSQIVYANAVQMLMLSRHLFKHLPTYLIRSKIEMACPLTKSISTQIRLPIDFTRQTSYVVQFIGNDLNAFTCKTLLTIYPHKSPQIKVNFHARNICKAKVYLVLCGSTIASYFGENLVFLLEGFPNELEISQSFVFQTKLYQIVKKNLTFDVPYEYPKEYEIWMSRERPNNFDQLTMTRWESTRAEHYTLNRLTFESGSISIEEDSQVANLTCSLACFTCESQTFWIIFRSNLADFIIQIVSNYRVSITDNVTIQDTKEPCICPNFPLQIDFECPLIHKVQIPLANIPLHNCILKLFKNSLSDEDKSFWATYLDNIVGLRFAKWFMKNSSCSAIDVFNFKQIYSITTDKNSILLRLLDGHDSNSIEFMIHIRGTSVKKTIITLTSWNKKEIRLCQVDIFREESNTGSLQSIKRK